MKKKLFVLLLMRCLVMNGMEEEELLDVNNLSIACLPWHDTDSIKRAIECGMDVNTVDLVADRNLLWFFMDYIESLSNVSKEWIDEWIDYFLAKGLNIHHVNNYRNTILHKVAKVLDKDFAEKCIKVGADVNAQNDAGNTALHCALLVSVSNKTSEQNQADRQVDFVKMLIAYDANVSLPNKDQEGPLFFTARMHNPLACVRIIPLLLVSGADAQACNNSQKIPYDYAQLYHPKNQEIGNMIKDKEGSNKVILHHVTQNLSQNLKSYDDLLQKFMFISYQ